MKSIKPLHKNWYSVSFIPMPAQPYLHHVHSQPIKISPEIWKQWYLEERSRDMVYFNVSSTAAFYEACSEVPAYLNPNPDGVDQMEFLAMYQMGRTIPRYMVEYQESVRTRSQLWEERLGTCFDVAKFASEHLELVEVLGSYGENEGMLLYL